MLSPLIVAVFCFAAVIAADAQSQRPVGNLLGPAQREYEQGHFDAALQTLEHLPDEERSTASALDLRGQIEMEQQKWEPAKASFEAAHRADAALVLPRLHGGDVLMRERKWSEARAVYEPLIKEMDVRVFTEQLSFGVLITYLGERNDSAAQAAREKVTFPTETPAYYYAQAAWAFSHGDKRGGENWITKAAEIFDAKKTAWFARPLFELGWLKTKPPLVVD